MSRRTLSVLRTFIALKFDRAQIESRTVHAIKTQLDPSRSRVENEELGILGALGILCAAAPLGVTRIHVLGRPNIRVCPVRTRSTAEWIGPSAGSDGPSAEGRRAEAAKLRRAAARATLTLSYRESTVKSDDASDH